MADWKIVYLINDKILQLHPEVERGRLVYRATGSGKRYSYSLIKKGLIKKEIIINKECPDWIVI